MTGLERARELRWIRDELDSLADDWSKRMRRARENEGRAVGDAVSEFARRRATLDVIEEVPSEYAADARLDRGWRQSLDEWEAKHLASAEEEYIALTVDAEIGPDVLTRLAAARDSVSSELASVLPGLTYHERDVFEKTAARSGRAD